MARTMCRRRAFCPALSRPYFSLRNSSGVSLYSGFRMTPFPRLPNEERLTSLRPYQTDCIDSILAAYKHGRRRLLVSLPTGTGKTVVFVSFVRAFRMKKKLLVLAHRDELLEQARDKLKQHVPEASVTIEQGVRHADRAAKVVVASVPTLGRANSKRLENRP